MKTERRHRWLRWAATLFVASSMCGVLAQPASAASSWSHPGHDYALI
jgi:hypothetical protein